MANIKFKYNRGIKIKDESKPHYIYLRYTLGRSVDFQTSIGVKVLWSDWNDDDEKVRNKTSIKDRFHINNLINNLTTHFNTFENENKSKGIIPTYKDVKDHYNSYFTKNEEVKDVTLFSFIDEFIETAKNVPNPVTKKLVKPNTSITSSSLILS